MPKQIILSLFIEIALILVTTLLLAQPESFFRKIGDRSRLAFRSTGYLLLCVTFCWSVVLGCLLSIHSMVIRA